MSVMPMIPVPGSVVRQVSHWRACGGKGFGRSFWSGVLQVAHDPVGRGAMAFLICLVEREWGGVLGWIDLVRFRARGLAYSVSLVELVQGTMR